MTLLYLITAIFTMLSLVLTVRRVPRAVTVLQAVAFVGDMILEIVKYAALIMVFVAIFDYLYQWWEYEKNLRMSKQEIKEEYKQTEGDPQIKGKIREKQRQMASRRMMQNVPNADVVIRNHPLRGGPGV